MLLKKVQINFGKMNHVVDSLVGVVRGQIGIDEEHEYKIRLVSKELLTNVLSYSDADDIVLTAALENGLLTITIEDNGEGFCYENLMERDVTKDNFIMRESGRGVFLVRMMSDDLKFNEKGNSVKVTLKLK